jgi:hypothetical protein
MTTAIRQMRYGVRRPTATPPPVVEGDIVAIGDQGAFAELSATWDGLEPAPLIGIRYAPFESVDSIGDIEWGGASGNFQTNRLHAWGPWELIEDAESILAAVVPVRCGASAGSFRFGLYRDNGSMQASTADVAAAGAYPAALIGMSAEQSLTANQAAAERVVTLNTGPVSAGHIWGAFWRSTTATGVEPIIIPSGVIARQLRASSGTPYSSAGAAPTTFPSGATGNNRYGGIWWATYRPVAPTAPSGLAASANGDRSITLSWLNTDSRTTRARIERRKNGGAWATAVVVQGNSYRDSDLEAGATYEYRVVACYKNAASSASGTASAVAGGVRTAAAIYVPTLLSRAPDDAMRGAYGLTHDLTGNTPSITQQLGYKRTGGTEWGDIQPTSSPSTFDWSEYTQHLNELGAKERSILRTRHAVSRAGNQLPPFVTANSSYYSIANESDGTTTWFANLGVAQVWTWAQAWIASFGANFANDARVALMKVGVHNRFGEWSGSMPSAAQISVGRQIDIIDAMLEAFPNKLFVMSCTPEEEVMWHASQQTRIIAFEQLSLGDPDSPNQYRRFWADTSPRVRRAILDRRMGKWVEHKSTDNNSDSASWLVGEYDMAQLGLTMLSDRNMSLASGMPEPNNTRMTNQVAFAGYRMDLPRLQLPIGVVRGQPFRVVAFWQNAGNGVYPPVEVRRAEFELWQGGARVWPTTPNGDGFAVTSLIPSSGAIAVQQTYTVSGIAAGTYEWRLRVPGADARTTEMALGITGRQSASGTYILATGVTVT